MLVVRILALQVFSALFIINIVSASFYMQLQILTNNPLTTITAGYIKPDEGFPIAWSSTSDSHPHSAKVLTTTFNKYKVNYNNENGQTSVSYNGAGWGTYWTKSVANYDNNNCYIVEICEADDNPEYCDFQDLMRTVAFETPDFGVC
jgi:hypothetical protein